MKNIFVPLIFFLFFSACSSEVDKIDTNSDIINNNIIYNSDLKISIKKNKDVLVFNSNEDFQNTVLKLNSYSIESALTDESYSFEYNYFINSSDITLKENGFHSLYDDFVNAMNEAENYYDRPGGYEEFKEKYPMLYFPEEGDDYSAYLPVSDVNIAKIVNSKCEAMINGEVVNFKNINSYQQLIDLGIAPSDDKLIASQAIANDLPLNHLPEVKCNDRKLWIKTHTSPGSGGVAEVITVEVCFRKKGFLGAWYNYQSETTLGWESGKSYDKSGFSSHDYKWAREFFNGPVPFRGVMWVQFRGFGAKCGDTKYYFRVDR